MPKQDEAIHNSSGHYVFECVCPIGWRSAVLKQRRWEPEWLVLYQLLCSLCKPTLCWPLSCCGSGVYLLKLLPVSPFWGSCLFIKSNVWAILLVYLSRIFISIVKDKHEAWFVSLCLLSLALYLTQSHGLLRKLWRCLCVYLLLMQESHVKGENKSELFTTYIYIHIHTHICMIWICN